jgi:hypothetical protein
MIDKQIEIGRCYGMKINMKNKSYENFKAAVTIMVDQKYLENVECFKYLG